MRSLLIISMFVLASACADAPEAEVASARGALAVAHEPLQVALPAAHALEALPLLAAPLSAVIAQPAERIVEGVPWHGRVRPPGLGPNLGVCVSEALVVGAIDDIDQFRLPPCLGAAPPLAVVVPLVLAAYGDELDWEGGAVTREDVIEGGWATPEQLDAIDAAANSTRALYYVASDGDHTLLVAYYPDQGKLFGIIVTVGDVLREP